MNSDFKKIIKNIQNLVMKFIQCPTKFYSTISLFSEKHYKQKNLKNKYECKRI